MMKSIQTVVLALGAAVLMTACAGGGNPAPEPSLSPAASSEAVTGNTWLSAKRLHELTGMSAYDALSLIPAYTAQVNRTPAPRFVVMLNKHQLIGLDALKTIRAEDVHEIRLVRETESVTASGAIEVVVTTIR